MDVTIYIYTPGTQTTSVFGRSFPPNTRAVSLQSKQGASFGELQVYKHIQSSDEQSPALVPKELNPPTVPPQKPPALSDSSFRALASVSAS